MFKHRLIIMTLALLVFAPAMAFAGDGGLYFGFGMGGRMINGSGNYLPRSEYDDASTGTGLHPRTSPISFSENKLTRVDAVVGIQLSDRFCADVTFSSYRQVEIDSYKYAGTGRGDTQQILDDEINGGDSYGVEAGSLYDQTTLRLTGQFYLNRMFFLTGGVEYIAIKTGYYLEDSYLYSYKDHTIGSVLGLGWEQSLNDKFSLITTANYAFAKYEGDGLRYDDMDLNIGGFDLGMELRYYVK